MVRVLAAAALCTSACTRADQPAVIAYSDGAVGPGPALAAQAAIDDWGKPRVAEIKLRWIEESRIRTGYTGDVDLAEAMVKLPGLVAAVGPLSSRATLVVAPIYAEQRIPLISATATTRKLGSVNPWVFPLAPDDVAEGAFIARFLSGNLGAKRPIIFYLIGDEYGVGLRDGVVDALRRSGVAPLDEVAISTHSDIPRLLAAALGRGVPDAIVVAARGGEAEELLRASHASLARVPVVLADGAVVDTQFLAELGGRERPVYGVSWWQPDAADSASRAFVARHLALTGVRPTAFDAMHYDALMLAAQAVREVGPERDAVRRYLTELGRTRAAYHGVTGRISFGVGRPANLIMTRVATGASVPLRDP